MCFGGKTNTTTSQVQIPKEVLARYNAVNANAEQTAATPFQSYSSDPSAFVAQLNGTQQKGISDISGAGGSAALGSLDTEKYFNPYVNDVAKSTTDLLTQQNEQEMSGQLGNAVSSGANFGDRSGVAAANLARQQQLGSASAISNILSQGYTQAQNVAGQQQSADLAARQADLARQAGVGQAELQAGTVQQQTDQAGKTALYDQFQQQRAYPFQTAQFLANIAEGTGALSGSTTTSTQPASFFGGLATGGAVKNRTGLAAGGFDPNAGAYGLGAGAPGAMGYVPAANLPVGHLMTADSPTPQHQTHLSDVMGAASNIENLAKNGSADWNKLKTMFASAPTLYANGGRTGLAAGGAFDPNAGVYGNGTGAPGAMGYVPQATMPVGHLMTAPATFAHSAGLGTIINDASAATNAIKNASSDWQSIKGMFSSGNHVSADTPNSDAENQAQMFGGPRASGGRVGLADGGLPYDSTNGNGYVPDNTPAQTPQLATAQTGNGSSGGGLGGLIGTASNAIGLASNIGKAAKFLIPFLASGGRVGLDTGGDPTDGNPTDGDPTDGSWADWLQQKAADLGLAENKPVAEIRKEAYGNTPPNYSMTGLGSGTLPQPHRGPASEQQPAPPSSSSNSVEDPLAIDPDAPREFRPGLGADIANLLSRGHDSQALGSLLKNGFTQERPGSPAEPVSGVAAAAIPTPAAETPVPSATLPAPAASPFQPILGANGQLSPDYQNAPVIGAPPAPSGVAAANLENSKGAVPIPAPNAAGPQVLGPKTMSQVPFQSSQGSAFEKASELMTNGEGLHVDTSEPGRPTLAGFELKQYQAINPNIRSFSDVGPRDVALAQKSWYDGQGGDQMAQKYGPNFAAAYVNLSMLNPNVAKQSLAQAGNDPNKFFGIMAQNLKGIAANKASQGFPDYTKGWMNRVADSQKVAGGAAPTQVADNSGPPASGLARAAMSPNISSAGDNSQPAPTGLAAAGNFFEKNKSTILPILQGLGAMASSPSRYFGTALLQGIGAGANAYQQYPALQANIAAKQAEARNTSAIGQGQNIANLQNAIHFQPGVGNMIAITQPDGSHTLMRFTDYQNLPDPKPVPWTGGADNGTSGPGTNTQSSGTSAMPTPSPANVQMPDGVSFSPEARKVANSDVAGSTGDYEGDKARAAEYFTNVNNSAIDARDNVPYTKQLVGTLITANRNGTSGNLFTQAADATNYLNSLARLAGINLPEPFLTSDDAQAISHKIGVLQAGERAKTGSQNSFAALDSFLGANPNPGMPPKAAAEIAAQIMTDQQKAQDRSVWMNAYRASGGNGAMQAADQFSKDNGPEKYAEDQRQLQKMILDIDPKTKSNFYEILSNTSGTLPQMQEALKVKGYSPSLARYFMTGR